MTYRQGILIGTISQWIIYQIYLVYKEGWEIYSYLLIPASLITLVITILLTIGSIKLWEWSKKGVRICQKSPQKK